MFVEEKKELILKKLKEQGLRITNQRKLIIDAILENEYSCCKEIYCQVCEVDSSIGIATVYRMIKVLEDIGAIDRRNMYRVCFNENCNKADRCIVQFDDNSQVRLSSEEWNKIVKAGLQSFGYLNNKNVELIEIIECNKNASVSVQN